MHTFAPLSHYQVAVDEGAVSRQPDVTGWVTIGPGRNPSAVPEAEMLSRPFIRQKMTCLS